MSGKQSVFEAHGSERAVVGAILRGEISMRDVDLTLADFTDLLCAEVFKTMGVLDSQDKPCDLVTVSDAMPGVETAALVELMQQGMVSGAQCGDYVATIKSAGMRRALSRTAQNLAVLAADGAVEPGKAAEAIRSEIDELAKNGPSQAVTPIAQIVAQMHDWLFAETRVDDSIKTGIGPLDAVLGGGIRGGKLCVIGARPSVGKSALGLFIAMNAAHEGKQVLVVSLEMDEAEIYARVLARYSGVAVDVIEARSFTNDQIERAVESYGDIAMMQLSITTRATTPAQLRAIALRQRQQKGLDLIVVDYLQLMNSGQKTGNRTEEVGQISRQLKQLAMELRIPVIAMTQMNRQSEAGTGEGGRMPRMSESRESGSIEQDANQFLILHAPGTDGVPDSQRQMAESCRSRGQTFMLIAVAKNRNGRKGYLPVAFDAPHMRFIPFDTRQEA